MTDTVTPETAATKARELLAARVTVVEKLAAAAAAHTTAQARADEAAKAFGQAYADAERAGWSTAELTQLGLRRPDRRAPGRPRSARKARTGEDPAQPAAT